MKNFSKDKTIKSGVGLISTAFILCCNVKAKLQLPLTQPGASFPSTHTTARQLFPSSSLMNDSRDICSSKRTLAIKRKSISLFYAYGNQNNWARTPSRFRVFSPIAGRVDMCKRNLFLSPFMLRRPQHLNQNIFSLRNSERERESEKRAESSGKTKFSNIFRSLFYLLCFASTAFFSFRQRKKAKTVPSKEFIAFKVNYWMFYLWRNRDQWFRVKSKRIVCFMSVVCGAQFQL